MWIYCRRQQTEKEKFFKMNPFNYNLSFLGHKLFKLIQYSILQCQTKLVKDYVFVITALQLRRQIIVHYTNKVKKSISALYPRNSHFLSLLFFFNNLPVYFSLSVSCLYKYSYFKQFRCELCRVVFLSMIPPIPIIQ